MTVARRSSPPLPREQPVVWSSSAAPAASLAWISRPRVGETVSGDAVIVRPLGDATLIAVVDALGHGPRAAEVADLCSAWLTEASAGAGAVALIEGLHEALRGSRGAAALVLVASPTGLEACSIGNVELRSMTGRLPFVLTPGVLGVRLRKPRVSAMAAPLTERFVLFSDGLSSRFDLRALGRHSPAELAAHLFGTHRYTHDDATVVVVDLA